MDDLADLDWSAPNSQAPGGSNNAPRFPAARQTPTPQFSGRSTPLSAQQSGASTAFKPSNIPPKSTTPANDSFAGLLSRSSAKPQTSQLSLQERQKQLQEEKLRQEAERRKQYDAHFGGSNSNFLDSLGSGRSTPDTAAHSTQRSAAGSPGASSLSQTINKPFAGLDTTIRRPVAPSQADDDLLSAFQASAPVDASSHFPPPRSNSAQSAGAQSSQAPRGRSPLSQEPADDDDFFGLSGLSKNAPSTQPVAPATDGDEDILGLLGKPVTEVRKTPEPPQAPPAQRDESPDLTNPQAKAVAELMDMGFPADKAAIALQTTVSGLDVQAAVGYLLNQAHAEAKSKQQQMGPSRDHPQRRGDDSDDHPQRSRPNRTREKDGAAPAWMRGDDSRSRSSNRRQNGETSRQEKDVAQVATEIGSSLFKSANSLWKTGRKQVQKAVADFQQDDNPNVPKWMRGAMAEGSEQPPQREASSRNAADVTDEALMLESGGRPTKPARTREKQPSPDPLALRQRQQQDQRSNPFMDREASRSPAPRPFSQTQDKRPATRLTRQDVEEQTGQAYVSPARRKKTTPQPDLFSMDSSGSSPAPASQQRPPPHSNNPFRQAAASAPKSRSPATASISPRPKAPPRQIPPVSSSALNTSAQFRAKGTEAFKRGDYGEAHSAYSSALSPLPRNHPITIIVLCNRAVTNIKVGDPKGAVADADAALEIIGISRGEGEKIVLGGAEGEKDMKEFYGKALMRKAEALEHMEKWADAGKVWKSAVEAGVGGSISIQGRNRCDKAAGKAATPAASQRPPVRKPAAPKPSAMSDLGGAAAPDSEAVRRLKEANAAAEKADDEKFALTDQVDAKLIAWKGTKADNLRALLGSLDKVLWPEAGWNKVNMGDLVMPNKVKITYMKAIAKVHPDKVCIFPSICCLSSLKSIRFPKQPPPSSG